MTKVTLGTSALDYLGFAPVDLDDLEALADDRGGYWQSAHSFISSLRDRVATELTFRQTSWAVDILDKLADLRRRGKI